MEKSKSFAFRRNGEPIQWKVDTMFCGNFVSLVEAISSSICFCIGGEMGGDW